MEDAYLAQLTEKERAALAVARRMLGAAFVLRNTTGYLKFKKDNPPK